MVLGRGWDYFCRRHKIVPGDLLVLRLFGLDLKVQVYNASSSIMCKVRCQKHSCLGDIRRAL